MRPAPSTPFEAPAFPLHSIGTYRRQPVKGHRLRTQGIVIHVVPGEYFFLQEQAIGVRIESSSRERLAVGDRVEAVGFLRRIEPTAFLSEPPIRPSPCPSMRMR
jgi:hypothetical protein